MSKTATLLVDGTNLYKIAFEGVKNYALQRKNIHAVWGFLKKLRGLLEYNHKGEHPHYITKVIIFWDGAKSGQLRKDIYPEYKGNREKYFEGNDPYYNQINILQDLLVDLGMVNYKHLFVETDDCIAYYVATHKDENNYIFTTDHDYFQLITNSTYVCYANRIKDVDDRYSNYKVINLQNFKHFFNYTYKNILIRKIILGDERDNIVGARGFSDKSIINEVPQMLHEELDREKLLALAEIKQESKKSPSKRLQILIDFLKNDDTYNLNKTLIDLSTPFITDDCKIEIDALPLPKKAYPEFISKIKSNGIHQEIKMDMDFYGDIKLFLSPFYSLSSFKTQ